MSKESPRVPTRPLSDPLGDADTVAGDPLQPRELELADLDPRYSDQGRLGRGGMGEVRLCQDLRIGRDVALKVIREDRAEHERAQTRFFMEARVQGQLQHHLNYKC